MVEATDMWGPVLELAHWSVGEVARRWAGAVGACPPILGPKTSDARVLAPGTITRLPLETPVTKREGGRHDPTPGGLKTKPSRLSLLPLSLALVGDARSRPHQTLRSTPPQPQPLRAAMAATADPRAKPPAAAPHQLLEPWARQPPPPPAAHRMPPAIPAVASAAAAGSGGCGARDRRRSTSHRRGGAAQVGVGEGPYDDGGIEALRAKLMGHLRDAADRLRAPHQPSRGGTTTSLPPPAPAPPPPPPAPSRKAASPSSPPPEADSSEPVLRAPPPPQQQQEPPQADAAAATTTTRPWNLRERTRRRPAAARSWAASPPPPGPPAPSSSRRRRKRAPFSVCLTPEEVEEDIYALTGARPRRRPRKRPRAVQRQLDSLFPGLWLTEITADAYRVPDD
ncbi:hypothetical protein U9M48_044798 [Paspalum notatum var. saurae]|uniref:DUF1639 family protein n=1 Tax=Paspalum notatum var. saurae TaxID=547442 RepID=A0AAQ3UXV2_PASNO